MGKLMHGARKHVRGLKTAAYLGNAIKAMNSLYKDMNIDPNEVYKRITHKPKSVCPETFRGTPYDYPLFDKGFETEPCNHGLPIWKLATVVKQFCDSSPGNVVKEIELFAKSVYELADSKIPVFISAHHSQHPNIKALGLHNLVSFNTNCSSDGTVFNYMLKHVKTKYVLVARDAARLDHDARLERLIREIESLDVIVAGGAIRYPSGHWKKGCFQSVYRNYSLKYFEGYDESLHGCTFCDYIHGPFVTSTKYLKEHPFNASLIETNGLYEDWFLRIVLQNGETVVCPDSLFHAQRLDTPHTRNKDWQVFMEKWDLVKLLTSGGRIKKRDCSKQVFKGYDRNARSPCDLQSLAYAVNTVMRLCEESQILCVLDSGTALGAVKFGKPLPWDIDADIQFRSANFSALYKMKTKFAKMGFRLVHNVKDTIHIFYKGWTVELFSVRRIITGNPTKLLFDRRFVNGPRNPGLWLRNRYGLEIFQHAHHWRITGDNSSWINYKTNVFQPCLNSGHNCLDMYNADGNLQFGDNLP
ncbi:ribitol 5-phosphate transferase FKRP-like [Lineus longissimus]|uniref:ribitol 5-phosphate transferase FKRP-like n=1 Tax=Lineus longissimus TaxID=88925 RepID=UPI00315C9E7B